MKNHEKLWKPWKTYEKRWKHILAPKTKVPGQGSKVAVGPGGGELSSADEGSEARVKSRSGLMLRSRDTSVPKKIRI